MLDLSVIILTYNEEQDIAKCLQSLAWCNDIHVLDSGSTDNTIFIAEEYGAKIQYNKFESFGKQRNYALKYCDVKNDWVLFLDADEIATPDFVVAIKKAIVEADDDTAGFYCCWKMILEGRWLKHCDNYPKWQFRLLKKGKATFTDFGHGQKEGTVFGEIKYIKEPYLHYGFSKGWIHWIDRHNRYSTLEALERIKNRPTFKQLCSRHKSIRNIALKSWLIKIPGWPLIRFSQAYILNLGFLEGIPGFIYCINIAYYEFLIKIKIREIKKSKL
jgi:glycosyltransferase involved in cell wall biosynthesis